MRWGGCCVRDGSGGGDAGGDAVCGGMCVYTGWNVYIWWYMGMQKRTRS